MLERLDIQNFQSHKFTSLKFTDGINIIVGRSLSGKTAIIRALLWLLNNRPLGFRFHSQFSGKKDVTKVELGLKENGNSTEISLSKSTQGSTYILDEKEFSGFGNEVPDQILRALNIDELNIQKQFDQPFLICSSPGEVARTLNRITQLEKIDEWNSKLTTRVNSANQEIRILESQLKEEEKQLEKYSNLDEIEKSVESAEHTESKLKETQQKAKNIEDILSKIETIDDNLLRYENVSDAEDKIEKLGVLSKKIQDEGDYILGLVAEIENLKETNQKIAKSQAILKIENDVKKLDSIWEKIKIKDDCIYDLECEVEDLQTVNQKLNATKKEYNKLKPKFTTLIRKLGKCPFCFSPIGDKQISVIIKELKK